MTERRQFTHSAPITVVEPLPANTERFQVCGGMHIDEDRAHTKDFSTGLTPNGDWTPAENEIFISRALSPLSGLTVFQVPPKVLETMAGIVADKKMRSGKPSAIPSPARRCLESLVSNVIGDGYSLDESVIVLRSYPSAGLQVGQTTDGLHFDADEPERLRLGINVGGIPRFVYYCPTRREKLFAMLGKPDDTRSVPTSTYSMIASLHLPIISARIEPGEGWALPTVEHLHDGRRAIPDGFSSFVLMTARKVV